MAKHSDNPAKSMTSEFDRFSNFMRRLVAVPHSEIKQKLEAEKQAKSASKRASVSRVSRPKS